MVMRNRGKGQFPGVGQRGGNGNLLLNDPRSLEQLFNQQQYPSVFKEFVHPGKDPKELLMRCIFKDERERNAAVLYYAKCEEFNLTEEKQVLLSWLASTVAVRGMARRELAMVSTGIIAPSLYGVHDWKSEKEQKKAEKSEE